MSVPRQGVYYDRRAREHVVVLVLDPEEAENLADGLPSTDGAVRELYDLAARARAADAEPLDQRPNSG